MAQMYQKLPSDILGVDDAYTAYCFNEACAYIRGMIDREEQPRFKKSYKSFSDIYKQYSR